MRDSAVALHESAEIIVNIYWPALAKLARGFRVLVISDHCEASAILTRWARSHASLRPGTRSPGPTRDGRGQMQDGCDPATFTGFHSRAAAACAQETMQVARPGH